MVAEKGQSITNDERRVSMVAEKGQSIPKPNDERRVCTVARWGHSHFEFHTSKFLQCKSHISPVQISHFSMLRWSVGAIPTSNFTHRNFSRANLTFLLCKSHISPVQISHFSSTNLTFLPYKSQCKSHISPVQISYFSRANLKSRLRTLALI